MENLKLSIIIPVFNAEHYLRRCLDSVINQVYKNLQIVIVDDGSNDASPQIIDEYAARDSRVVVHHKSNGGIGSAYKVAFGLINGDYVTFVDSDDYIELNAYSDVFAQAAKYSPDLIHFAATVYDEKGVNLNVSSFKSFDNYFDNKNDIIKNHFEVLKHPSLIRIYKQKLFTNIEIFEQNIGIDEMLTPQLISRCNSAFYTSKSYYNVTARDESVCRSVYNEKKIIDSLRVYKFINKFMAENIPEYYTYTSTKYLTTLNLFMNLKLDAGFLMSDKVKKEIDKQFNSTFKAVYRTHNFTELNFKLRYSIVLLYWFPGLYKLLLKLK